MKTLIYTIGLYLFFNVTHETIRCQQLDLEKTTVQEKSPTTNFDKEFVFSPTPIPQNAITPEMFGAIGDGKIHKLSARYTTIEEARKDFPNLKDLDITFDGAAFQKAVDFAATKNSEVIAVKNYAINFPIITRDNVTIDGQNKGVIFNDRSRSKNIFSIAFFFGDHSASAFNKPENKAGYNLYDVAGPVSAGQNFVELAHSPDNSSFKVGQLVMLISSSKRPQNLKKTLLPYHVTISKIANIDGKKLSFEYPINENISSAQIAANGSYDGLTEMNYAGVQNVTVRNLTIDAWEFTLRTYGYKCNIDNITVTNALHLIGLNAMTHSSFTNISGNFSLRCIEIKTGSSDLLLRNINGSYKAVPNESCIDGISTGEYNRDINIDSFTIDFKTASPKLPAINLHSRKATISNGSIICKNQTTSFLQFYNERYVDDPQFGCFANVVRNVKFYGGPSMKNVLYIGEKGNDAAKNNKNNWAHSKNMNKRKNAAEDDEELSNEDNNGATANVPPTKNTVENCLFDGGSSTSSAVLSEGENNIVQNCNFTKAKLNISPDFRQKNIIDKNQTKTQ